MCDTKESKRESSLASKYHKFVILKETKALNALILNATVKQERGSFIMQRPEVIDVIGNLCDSMTDFDWLFAPLAISISITIIMLFSGLLVLVAEDIEFKLDQNIGDFSLVIPLMFLCIWSNVRGTVGLNEF